MTTASPRRTFTAVSEHVGPQTDTLTLRGDWGPGRHAVRVEFLNDAYGGTPEARAIAYGFLPG